MSYETYQTWKLLNKAILPVNVSPSNMLSWIDNMCVLLTKKGNQLKSSLLYHNSLMYVKMHGLTDKFIEALYKTVILSGNILEEIRKNPNTHFRDVERYTDKLLKVISFCQMVCNTLEDKNY